tara:strand:+ start:111 stop:485 length:375 start_codon:yes stop_codon:yes gene_type:complete
MGQLNDWRSRPRKSVHRRTDEEIIAECQAKIDILEGRISSRKLLAHNGYRELLSAMRKVEAAYLGREDDEDRALIYHLLDVRQRMASFFGNCGMPQPDFDLPRKGPPPKAARVSNGYGDPNAHA